MKKIFILILISLSMFCSQIIVAQINIEIDKAVFPQEINGAYYSANKDVVIIPLLINSNFNDLINSYTNDLGEHVKTGFIKGTQIFYITEEEQRYEKIYSIYSFSIKVSDTQTISLITGFPIEDKEIYYKTIIKAVKSAKLN
jgi:hypothetical protein